MSREASKVTVMMLVPSLPLVEVMYRMPSTPLSSCSRGTVTALSTMSELAPTYVLVTVTCGGAKSGYCAMGREGMDKTPANVTRMEQTAAKIGRRMKKSTNKGASL